MGATRAIAVGTALMFYILFVRGLAIFRQTPLEQRTLQVKLNVVSNIKWLAAGITCNGLGMIVSYQVGVRELDGEVNHYSETLGKHIDLNEASVQAGAAMVIGLAVTFWWYKSYQKWYDVFKRDEEKEME